MCFSEILEDGEGIVDLQVGEGEGREEGNQGARGGGFDLLGCKSCLGVFLDWGHTSRSLT